MPTQKQWEFARKRQAMYAGLRSFFTAEGYWEVETPCMVAFPSMELHIESFEVCLCRQGGRGPQKLYLHASPEYAMKRLLADGSPPLFQIGKAFRNEELSALHNPEFSMLEFYRPHSDYRAIMEDTEGALAAAERAVLRGRGFFSQRPYERVTVREAFLRETGIDIGAYISTQGRHDGRGLREAALAGGIFVGSSEAFEDVFFQIFLERIEGKLGRERPTFLLEYPACMAALARLKPGEARFAERVELYARGVELGNGFSELNDAIEQRRRLEEERRQRESLGRVAHRVDEGFLRALPRMPASSGIAVGLDRVLMLLLGANSIAEVLLFPVEEFFGWS
ncbi:MAG: EF-P lysine aminoacylase EpmA [Proteobacteria bacterium]|nr:EF-P lysine aminoacylase EpmA [Cystobacterineae bacterium]MCL2259509.1 EF-P lysine aminoacylase EpmA [Cystobacterineae bacterium]MCL2314041.1 EF-P lysine aminoacylase EpmA [Pseudomonadota bacterium]